MSKGEAGQGTPVWLSQVAEVAEGRCLERGRAGVERATRAGKACTCVRKGLFKIMD